MDRLLPPKPLLLEGNLVENWKRWKKDFSFYMTATEHDDKADNVKASLLIHCIGDKAREIYDTLTFDADGDDMKLDKILEKFEAYLAPRKNVTYSRYKFFTYREEEGMSFNKYLPEMKKLGGDCELGTLQNSLLKDMLIIGLLDKRIQEDLLRDSNVTSEQVLSTCPNAELTRQQAKSMQQSSSHEYVDAVYKFSSHGFNKNYHDKTPKRDSSKYQTDFYK